MWKYTGGPSGNGYLSGVPARDISEEEWAEIPSEDRATARSLKLYEHQVPRKTPVPKQAKEVEPEKPAESTENPAE